MFFLNGVINCMNSQIFKIVLLSVCILSAHKHLHGMDGQVLTWKSDSTISTANKEPFQRLHETSFTWQENSYGSSIDAIAIVGNRVITGSQSGVIKYWDIFNHALVSEYDYEEGIRQIKVEEDKITIIGLSGLARDYDRNDGKFLDRYGYYSCPFMDNISFTIGNKNIYADYADNAEARVCKDMVPLFNLTGHQGKIFAIAGDKDKVITGSKDHTARVWNVNDGTCLCTLEGHQTTVYFVALYGDKAFTASYDGTIKMWNINDGNCMRTFPSENMFLKSIAFDGENIAMGFHDGTVTVWYGDRSFCRKGMFAFAMAALNDRIGITSHASVLSQPLLRYLSEFVVPARSWE